MCDIVPIPKMFVHLSIAKEAIVYGKSSNIIYSFANAVQFEALINILYRFKREHF
jgi:hypothetical protein